MCHEMLLTEHTVIGICSGYGLRGRVIKYNCNNRHITKRINLVFAKLFILYVNEDTMMQARKTLL